MQLLDQGKVECKISYACTIPDEGVDCLLSFDFVSLRADYFNELTMFGKSQHPTDYRFYGEST